MKYDVFISYSRKDQVIVDEIRQLLDSNAITYWLDTEKVHMGSEFMADIVDAIENSTITLFISSSDSNNSIYTAKEVALAFNAGKYIIPVADIKSLLYGERKEEVINVEEREYIDVLQWNEPQNKILRFIKRIFEDK